MKRLAALLLAAVMLMGLVSFASADEYVKLTWVQGNSPAPVDNNKVLEELNKISREKLGVECEIIYMSSDEVMTSIQAGEVYDMYFTCSWFNNFNMNVANGIFANIWGKVQEWAPELWAIMPENVWELARSTDGGLYAIPVKKDYAPENFISYDAQVAADAGIEVPDVITSWDELTPYLEALKKAMEADPSLGQYPVNVGGRPAGMETSFDFIDRIPLIGVKFGSTEVISVFDDEDVVDRYFTMKKWMDMGLVNPDSSTQSETSVDKSLHHITFEQAVDGYDYTPARGFWTKTVRYSGPFINTDGVQGAMNAFSVTLEDDPERFELAMKYQELVNTDKTYRDIMCYGIPGEHFEYRDVTDDNGNVLGQVVVRTELGRNNYSPWDFSQAACDLLSLEASEEMLDGTYPAPQLDQWDVYFAACETAPISKISGFTFNYMEPIDFSSNYAEISNITDEYLRNIQCGSVEDTATAISEIRVKMEAAGLSDIIAEAQRQLDEYLAGQVK